MSRPLLRRFACALVAAVALPLPAAEPQGPALNPVDLRCDYLVNPLGIDDLQPALSWKLAGGAAGRRGLSQSAYQLLVASGPSPLAQEQADLWDSGAWTLRNRSTSPTEANRSRRESNVGGKSAFGTRRAWLPPGANRPSGRWACSNPRIGKGRSGSAWTGAIGTSRSISATWPRPNGSGFPKETGRSNAPTETRYFRRSFPLPADRQVRRAVAMFAADDHCTLSVNGVQVGIGHGHPNLIAAEITAQLRPAPTC